MLCLMKYCMMTMNDQSGGMWEEVAVPTLISNSLICLDTL